MGARLALLCRGDALGTRDTQAIGNSGSWATASWNALETLSFGVNFASDAGQVCIREATASDWRDVAELMDLALTGLYDGDHKAHARRIFETPLWEASTRLATSP